MEEFVDVCKALWASVDADAIVAERATGVFADAAKIHAIHHRGPHFSVRGPLNSVPSPQRRPVLVQAGASPRGVRASAHFADIVFAQSGTLSTLRRHRAALDLALVAEGREPRDVGVLWSVQLIIAETSEEAKGRKEHLLDALAPEAVGVYLSHNSGYDFSTLPTRFDLEDLADRIAATNATQAGFVQRLLAERGGDTLITRDEFFSRANASVSGYDTVFAGTATEVADHLEETFEATGCNGGFMMSTPEAMSKTLLAISDLLVPELQRRGRFRHCYEGDTLAANLLGHDLENW
jgi:alkanesulfonate monooxygenase SsuD/methylene tetrahydromethanopterin reductase-like flavin-dependent oxidoreductase (luciferase family)